MSFTLSDVSAFLLDLFQVDDCQPFFVAPYYQMFPGQIVVCNFVHCDFETLGYYYQRLALHWSIDPLATKLHEKKVECADMRRCLSMQFENISSGIPGG